MPSRTSPTARRQAALAAIRARNYRRAGGNIVTPSAPKAAAGPVGGLVAIAEHTIRRAEDQMWKAERAWDAVLYAAPEEMRSKLLEARVESQKVLPLADDALNRSKEVQSALAPHSYAQAYIPGEGIPQDPRTDVWNSQVTRWENEKATWAQRNAEAGGGGGRGAVGGGRSSGG